MEEYELLKKFFIEKEKENLKLKQELISIKKKLSEDNLDSSQISEKQSENNYSKLSKEISIKIFFVFIKI